MNPRDFCELASELVVDNNAAKIRTAIGRAYYAAFNTGFEVLTNMGFSPSTGSSGHMDVQRHLSNSGDNDIVKASVQLNNLFSKRIRADYKLDKKDVESQKTAQALVKEASGIISTLDISASSFGGKRSGIIKSIEEWKKKGL